MIALLLPTRNKPEELIRIIREVDETTNGNVHVYAYVAMDDPQLARYQSIMNTDLDKITFGEPLGFSWAINKLSEIALSNPKTTMLMRCEDDFYFVKKDWDLAYMSAVPHDDVAMVWCNYVLKDKNAEPHTAAITRLWFNTLGYFSLPTLRHYFCDNVLKDLAEEIGRAIYIPEPFIDHRYNPHDPRKKFNFEKPQYSEDSVEYSKWKTTRFKSDAEKLKMLIK